MTREELFVLFPRPWKASDDHDPGVILDAEGEIVLTVDPDRDREDEDVGALADLLVELVNGAEE